MDAACVYTFLLPFWEELQYQKVGLSLVFGSVQPLSPVLHFADPQITACQAPLPSTTVQNLLKFMSIELAMLSNHFIFRCPLLLLLTIIPIIRDSPPLH